MDIQPIVPSSSTPAKSAQAGSLIGSDFNTFLKMLTVQMQNQDPLNPLEATDYAVQLATFSGVEQQVRANQLLTQMSGQFSVMGMAQLAGWVGQEARTSAPVQYDGNPITLSPNPAARADAAVLVVTDAKGAVVARETLPIGTAPYQWLGADAAGNPLPPGRYSLSLESRLGEETLRTDPVEAYHPILEVRRNADGVRLVLRGGVEVDAATVTALRVP
jgi:flagellar basal-body rod modification protein FlgD